MANKVYSNLNKTDKERCKVYFTTLGCNVSEKGENVKVTSTMDEKTFGHFCERFYRDVLCSVD